MCRRKSLLDYFVEVPAFGQRRGKCNTCLSVAKYGADSQRDSRVLLCAVFSLKEQGLSQIMNVVGGNKVEDYRYAVGKNSPAIQQAMAAEKENLPRKYPLAYYRGINQKYNGPGLSAFVGNIQSHSSEHTAFRDRSAIMLPVPESVRQHECKEQERRERVLAKLEENGIKLDKLPQEEVEKGDDEVIRAYSKWHSYRESLQRFGWESWNVFLSSKLFFQLSKMEIKDCDQVSDGSWNCLARAHSCVNPLHNCNHVAWYEDGLAFFDRSRRAHTRARQSDECTGPVG